MWAKPIFYLSFFMIVYYLRWCYISWVGFFFFSSSVLCTLWCLLLSPAPPRPSPSYRQFLLEYFINVACLRWLQYAPYRTRISIRRVKNRTSWTKYRTYGAWQLSNFCRIPKLANKQWNEDVNNINLNNKMLLELFTGKTGVDQQNSNLNKSEEAPLPYPTVFGYR